MKGKGKQLSTEEVPTVRAVLDKLLTPGTALFYPGTEIVFSNQLSPVKSLQVRICSTEADNMAVLHKLHTLTRTTNPS